MKFSKQTASVLHLMLAAVLLFGLLLNVASVPAHAAGKQSSSEIMEQIKEMQNQQKENKEEIKKLEAQLKENLTEMEAIVAQKNIIDQEIFLLHAQVTNTNNMISAYNVLIADKQAELSKAQEKLTQLNEKNKERIRAMEEEGPLSYWAVLFKANSFSDLLDRLNIVQEIAAADQRLLREMREVAAKVAVAQEELVADKANLLIVREELAVTEATLQEKRLETEELLKKLIATGEEFEQYLAESEEIQQQLAQDIASAKKEYEDAKESEYWEAYWATYVPPTTQPPTTKPYIPPTTSVVTPPVSGGWVFPMTRKTWVTSPYGMRVHPLKGTWTMHHGVDFEGDRGDDIVATRAGVVLKAAWSNSMGYYVNIDHGDGYTSIYMHMTHYVVKTGDKVSAGQKIGECGSTGDSTGDHLHFGIYYNGQSVNPMNYVKLK